MDIGDTVLIVAAHPDDEVLGAGASAARWTAEGRRVYSLILAEGITSRYSRVDEHAIEEVARLREQAGRAHEFIGDRLLPLEDFPDNRMDSVALLDVVKRVEDAVNELQPSCVLTHGPWDVNIDHRRIHEAVLAACRSIPGSPVRTLACFPVLSSTEWRGDPQTSFTPNLFVDVTGFEVAKAKALASYVGEMREAPHPRSVEVARAQMTVWGSVIGSSSAEAFQIVRLVC